MSKALEDYVTQLGQITLLKDATTKGSIRWYIKWYEEHFPRAHWKYRLAGVGVLSVALYAALGLKGEDWLSASFVAAMAAFLVSLNAFFAWGTAWRVYFHAKVRLEFLLQAYEARLIDARAQSDETKATEIVRAGFDELLQKSGEAIAEETKGYFESLKFPSFKKGVKG
jgi:hypothetical protein